MAKMTRRMVCMMAIGLFFSAAMWVSGCGTSGEGQGSSTGSPTTERVLHLYHWGDFKPEVLDAFEKATGIHVVADTYDSNEAMVAKLQAGATGYDLVCPAQYAVQELSKLGLIQELDLSRIPNIGNLMPEFTKTEYDPGNKWSIPIFWGTTGLAYNSKYITDPVDSWNVLWDEKYKGKIMMLDNMLACYIPALQVNGFSANTKEPAEIEKATNDLLAQKPLLLGYNSSNNAQLLAQGQVWVELAWSSQIAPLITEDKAIRYVLPKEGGTYWTQGLSIVKTAENVSEAYEFISFLLGPEVGKELVTSAGMAVTNAPAMQALPADVRDNEAMFTPTDQLARAETILDPAGAATYFQKGWTKVKAE